MEDRIKQRIEEISKEMEELVNERANIQDREHEINVRLAHLVGAMQELDSLLK